MKNIINLLAISALTLVLACNQNMDSTIQKLIDSKLIKKKEAKNMIIFLKGTLLPSPADYLEALYKVKIGIRPGQFTNVSVDYSTFQPTKEEQMVINKEFINDLKKLKQCELVSEKQFQKYIEKIYQNQFVSFLQILSELAKESD